MSEDHPKGMSGPVIGGVDDDLVERLAIRFQSASAESAPEWKQTPDPERNIYRARARSVLLAISDAGYLIRPAEIIDGDDIRGDHAGERESSLDASLRKAERLLHAGEPLLAYNALQRGLEDWPEHVRLRQLHGLALARSGVTGRANRILQALRDEGHADGETLGLLARTHKDLGLSARDRDERLVNLNAAFDLYEQAYRASVAQDRIADAYYTGINAAAMAFILGRKERAQEIAQHVVSLCRSELESEQDEAHAYWIRATLAEASLILGDTEAAERQYVAAAGLARHRFGDLGSTRHQARLLLRQMGADDRWLDQTLAIPPVLIVTGHMIDSPDRAEPRFPPDLEERVRREIDRRIERIGPVAAYGSAACGTDILCLEAVHQAGGEIHITLPFPPDEFRPVSVDFPTGGDWGTRFERLLEIAVDVSVASDHRAAGSVSTFEYANMIITGLAALRARVLGTSLLGFAVLDEAVAGDPGGTASHIGLWNEYGIPSQVVDLTKLRGEAGITTNVECSRAVEHRPAEPPDEPAFSHEIKSMLFADAVGYSKLTEDQIPLFIEHCLGGIADLNRASRHAPVHSETAGDGLYMVFSNAEDAGHYALELGDLFAGTDWTRVGLPSGLEMRIALHCGPVFCGRDPITDLAIYTGPHTSRTARIEPITPPGQVYASNAFAAVAAATGVRGLEFTYIGRTRLAKKYGSLQLFHVRRQATEQGVDVTDPRVR